MTTVGWLAVRRFAGGPQPSRLLLCHRPLLLILNTAPRLPFGSPLLLLFALLLLPPPALLPGFL